jgi:cytochrome P450
MYRRFPALCARGSAAHGSLFWIQGGPGAEQLMCTDAAALDALKAPQASTSFYAEGFEALLSNTLFAFDGSEHRRVRGVMAPAFTPARLQKTDVYAVIAEIVQRRIAGWTARIDVLTSTKDVALEIAFRLIGIDERDISSWRKQFSRYVLAALPARPVRWLAGRARDWLDERLGSIVDRARASAGKTLVDVIANARDEDGALLDRHLVVANLRLLVLAGHETTASALAWNLLHFAASPEDQRRAREEATRGDLVALAADSNRFTFAEAQFREALRLYPAVHSVIRRLTGELRLPDVAIPAGTLLNVPLVHLLRDPQLFPAPDRYRPERWTERPRPGTIATAMFGGGPHFCLGYHIAIAEGTLFNLHLARMLAERQLRLRPSRPGPLPNPIYLPLSRPPRGLTVEFEHDA